MDWFGIGRDTGRRRRDGEGARRARVPGALRQSCDSRACYERTINHVRSVRARDVRGPVKPRGVAVLEDDAELREAHARDVRLGRLGLGLALGVLREFGIVFSELLCLQCRRSG